MVLFLFSKKYRTTNITNNNEKNAGIFLRGKIPDSCNWFVYSKVSFDTRISQIIIGVSYLFFKKKLLQKPQKKS